MSDRPGFDAAAWARVGIPREQAEVWWRGRIDPHTALRWRRAGVAEPRDAVRWRTAGIGVDDVERWIQGKIGPGEAVVWVELGFDAGAAAEHKRAGRSPVQAFAAERAHPTPPATAGRRVSGPRLGRHAHGPQRLMEAVGQDPKARHVLHSYMHRQWFDEDAATWAARGIDASEAQAWKELGLAPAEAERQQKRGRSAMQTAMEWCRAGVPVDEVADWLGAGLTPAEAVAQRATGVTAERAAILRSLRRDA
jgi:hypothetical protein